MMKRILICFFFLICGFSFLSYAQSDSLTDEGDEQMDLALDGNLSEGNTTTNYSMWSDPIYYQFDKMMPDLARSLGRLNSRISTVAVTDLDFSPNLDESFRKVATAKLFGQLLLENPRLRLIKCDECSMVRSEIKAGVLTVNRGLSNQADRKKLAKKLGVQGFMTAMIIENERQLTIVLKVHDAQEGRIILSDVIAGIPVPENRYYNTYLGQIIFPIKLASGTTLDHSGLMIGVEQSMRFSEYFMLGANIAAFKDNNETLDEGHETLSTGFLFDGFVEGELSLMNNNAALAGVFGLGQFISQQFNFAVYQKLGVQITIGQKLTFNYFLYFFNETNLEAPSNGVAPKLTGNASSLAFGWQF